MAEESGEKEVEMEDGRTKEDKCLVSWDGEGVKALTKLASQAHSQSVGSPLLAQEGTELALGGFEICWPVEEGRAQQWSVEMAFKRSASSKILRLWSILCAYVTKDM